MENHFGKFQKEKYTGSINPTIYVTFCLGAPKLKNVGAKK